MEPNSKNFEHFSLDILHKWANELYPQLSKVELDAIHHYCGTFAYDMNKYLRENKGEYDKAIPVLDQIHQKSFCPIDGIVFRGCIIHTIEGLDSCKVGDILNDRGFISTSTKEKEALNFAKHYAESPENFEVAFLTIDIPQGTPCYFVAWDYLMGMLTGYECIGEGEIIIKRNTNLLVKEISERMMENKPIKTIHLGLIMILQET